MPERLPHLSVLRPHLFRSEFGRDWVCLQHGHRIARGYGWREAWDNFQRINPTAKAADEKKK